ncbi:MAG: site-2 protease family protein [Candidatus Merdivicinus sp.]|jgi:Zn-dependent protease
MSDNIVYLLYQTTIRLVVLLTALPFHEFAHAWAANKMGDSTARYQGRLTLNPLAHLDPLGSLLMLFAGFGWAKPVPINPRNFKNPKKGMALSAAAGPLSNLLLAYLGMVLWKVVLYLQYPFGDSFLIESLSDIFRLIVLLNLGLAVFNLLPVPPLDGSRLFTVFLPPRQYFQIMQYERYIQLALFVAIFMGLLDRPLAFVEGYVFQGLNFLTGYIDWIAQALLG